MTEYRVIWIDSSDRKASLNKCFENGVDWFNSNVTDISNVDAVFVHATDIQLSQQDDEIELEGFADKDKSEANTVKLAKRLIEFRNFIRSIKNKSTPLLVYSGSDVKEDAILSYFMKIVSNHNRDFLRVAPLILRDVSTDKLNNLLAAHLKAKTQAEAVEILKKDQQKTQVTSDCASAIDLVSEVVRWLRVTRPQKTLHTEMKDFRTRLSNKFGTKGEGLLEELADRLTESDVPALIKMMVEKQTRSNRIETWKMTGMLLNTDKKK